VARRVSVAWANRIGRRVAGQAQSALLEELAPKPSKDDRYKQQLLEAMRTAGVPAATFEYAFAELAIGRRWRFDLCWPSKLIALEVEGAVFGRSIKGADGKTYRMGGRHNTGAGAQSDCEKYSWAAILGWAVVRVTTTMIRDGHALPLLIEAFKRRGGLTRVGKE
jgi:hypothetical protein